MATTVYNHSLKHSFEPWKNSDWIHKKYHHPEQLMNIGGKGIVFKNASVLCQKTCPPGMKHPVYYGFNYITAGSVDFRYSAKETYSLRPGDFMAIFPNSSFALSGIFYRYQFVSFTGRGAEAFFADIGFAAKMRMVKQVPVQIRTLMNQIIKAGMENRDNPCFFLSRIFGIGDMVYQINRQSVWKQKQSYPELIKLIAEQRDYQQLSIANIAAELNVCPDTLRKACLKKIHMPASSYLTQLKITRAKELLVSTPYKAACISAAAGFGSEKHFFKAFKLNTGKTPLEWRASETPSRAP